MVYCFFQIQRPENLPDLALEGRGAVIGDVFDQLLGQGRTTLTILAQTEHLVEEGIYRTDPVHTLMLLKPLVLTGDHHILYHLRNIRQLHPDTVFHTVEPVKFIELTGFGIIRIQDGGIVQIQAVQIDIHIGLHKLDDIYRHHHCADTSSDHQYQKRNGKDAANDGEYAANTFADASQHTPSGAFFVVLLGSHRIASLMVMPSFCFPEPFLPRLQGKAG